MVYRLDHDNGIIHHNTNGEHQRKHRQYGEREPKYLQKKERTNQQDGDSNRRYQRGSEVLQENEDTDKHQDKGHEKRMLDLADRFIDLFANRIGNLVINTLGEILPLFGEHLSYFHVDIVRI